MLVRTGGILVLLPASAAGSKSKATIAAHSASCSAPSSSPIRVCSTAAANAARPPRFALCPLCSPNRSPSSCYSWIGKSTLAFNEVESAIYLSSRLRPSDAVGMRFVFSVCRLVSRRCHSISAIHQLCLSPSQNRTKGFPLYGSSLNRSASQKGSG